MPLATSVRWCERCAVARAELVVTAETGELWACAGCVHPGEHAAHDGRLA